MIRPRWLAVSLSSILTAAVLAGATPASPQTSSAEKQLADIDQQWVQAEMARNADALGRILDDQFVATLGTGKPLDKQGFIDTIVGDGALSPPSQTISDRTVRIDGDTAILVETDTVNGSDNGTIYTHLYRCTITYVRRNGHWVALALHMVRQRDSD